MADHKTDDELQKARRSTGGKSSLQIGKSTQFLNRSMSRLKMRKPSYGFSSVPGIGRVQSSQVAFEFRRPAQIYLPTYQLDPKTPFHLATVLKMINAEMDEHCTEHKYNVQQSPALALKMATSLLKQCKERFDRYRILSVVTIGQRRAQSFSNAVSFLWDHERDGYADVERVNLTCFFQITVFGIYLD